MKIKTAGLAEGVHQYEFEEVPSLLGLDENYSSSVKTKIKLTKTGRQILLESSSETEKKCVCDRCLSEFMITLNADFKLLYTSEKQADQIDIEDFVYLNIEEAEIDVNDDIREMILLSVPMKLLCNEDCKGLCQNCGINLNIEECKCSKKYINPIFNELTKLKFQ